MKPWFTDKMPVTTGKPLIITYKNNKGAKSVSIAIHTGNWTWKFMGSQKATMKSENVIAWQNLPKPYRSTGEKAGA